MVMDTSVKDDAAIVSNIIFINKQYHYKFKNVKGYLKLYFNKNKK